MRKVLWCCTAVLFTAVCLAHGASTYAVGHPQSVAARFVVASYTLFGSNPLYRAGTVTVAGAAVVRWGLAARVAAVPVDCAGDEVFTPQPLLHSGPSTTRHTVVMIPGTQSIAGAAAWGAATCTALPAAATFPALAARTGRRT